LRRNKVKEEEVEVQQEVEDNKVAEEDFQLKKKKPTTHTNKNNHQKEVSLEE
jgi:hypothetical protein